jgi:protein O-GlcNAc transferase
VRFARHLEAAYSQMWETWVDGKPTQPFAVASIENTKPQSEAPVQQIARHIYATCPLCGSGAHKVLFSADCSKDPAYRRELVPQVQWHVCEDCDHVFADGHFAAGTFAPSAFGHDMEVGRRTAAPLVTSVARHIGARNCDAAWLDVGFGSGALLLTAAEFGFETVGLESSPAHVAALRQLGFEGHVDTIEGFEAPGRFAIVSLDDQLPRLADPVAALVAAHQLLQVDGLLVLSLPNMDAMPFNLLHAQNANPYWDEIARTQMFGRERLYALLREQGFQPLEYQVSPRLRIGMDVIARRIG